MKNMIRFATGTLLAAVLTLAGGGCAAFQASTMEVDPSQPRHFDNRVDYTDLRQVTSYVTGSLLSSPFLNKHEEPPVMMVAGVQNRMSEYFDTKNLTDKLRTQLLNSGKVRFVNAARRGDLLKEQGYQSANATPDTAVAVGKQLGAQYMFSGSITEMKTQSPDQVRIRREEIRYYKLTAEVTDLASGELVWTDEKEFARWMSKPLIRW